MTPDIQDDRQQLFLLVKSFRTDRRLYRTILKSSMPGTIRKHGCRLMRGCRITDRVISGYFDMLIYYYSHQKLIMKLVIRQKHLNISIWYVPEQEEQIILFFLMSLRLCRTISEKKFIMSDEWNWLWNSIDGLISPVVAALLMYWDHLDLILILQKIHYFRYLNLKLILPEVFWFRIRIT